MHALSASNPQISDSHLKGKKPPTQTGGMTVRVLRAATASPAIPEAGEQGGELEPDRLAQLCPLTNPRPQNAGTFAAQLGAAFSP